MLPLTVAPAALRLHMFGLLTLMPWHLRSRPMLAPFSLTSPRALRFDRSTNPSQRSPSASIAFTSSLPVAAAAGFPIVPDMATSP